MITITIAAFISLLIGTAISLTFLGYVVAAFAIYMFYKIFDKADHE